MQIVPYQHLVSWCLFPDCRATAHPECKDLVALPCIPTTSTPTNAKTNGGVCMIIPIEGKWSV